MMNFFDKEEILKSYIRSERYEAAQKATQEATRRATQETTLRATQKTKKTASYLSLLIYDSNISSLSKKIHHKPTLPCYSDIPLKHHYFLHMIYFIVLHVYFTISSSYANCMTSFLISSISTGDKSG